MDSKFTHLLSSMLFVIFALNSSAQTTVYCSATGSSGSYTTGYATLTSRVDGDPQISGSIISPNAQRGYAVFDLSTVSIPSTATITSVTLTLHFTYSGANNGLSITTYDTTIDLSAVTSANTLYNDIQSGNIMYASTSFGTSSSSPITLASTAAAVSFVQAHYNSKISLGWTTGTVVSTNGGTYTFTGESGSGGSATATAPTLAITYTGCLPTIQISHNGPDTVCVPASITFTSSITNGGTSPSYQWKKNGTTITGATTPNYSVSITSASTDVYYCVLTSNASCATTSTMNSNNDTITAISSAAPTIHITASPSTPICSGTSVTFSSTSIYGGSSPAYQWKKNGTNITGATSSTYTTSTAGNGDIFTCVLTSSLSCASPGTATSNSDTVSVSATVAPTISISAIPGDTICNGTSVTFTSNITNGGTAPTYQWKKNGVNIPGATGSSYTSSTLANSNIITCVVTSSLPCASPATATSTAITMAVNSTAGPTINITASPGNSICVGDIITFHSTISNGGTSPQYQWQLNGSNIPGATNSTYTTGAINNGDIFTCILTSNAPCISSNIDTSNAITITVNVNSTPLVTISANPPNPISSGTNVTFTAYVTNGGTSPTFQWRKNGTNIGGATSNPYITSALNNNDVIDVLVQSNAPCSFPDTSSSNKDTVVVTPSGLAQVSLSQNSIRLYPNPTNGKFTMSVPCSGTLHLISMLGQDVCSFTITQNITPVNLPADLPKSIYLGKFIPDEGNTVSIVRIIYE